MSEAALLQRALVVARTAATAAAEAIRPYFRQADLSVENKEDASPVTEADRAAERIIREHIASAFPDHDICGEEYGGDAAGTGWQWLVDPLDGTRSFVRGSPIFSTQIALWHEGRPMLGVSHVPITGECAWAVRGIGAFVAMPGESERRLHCRNTTSIEQAAISTGNLKTLAADSVRWSALAELTRAAWRLRGYGDYLHYHLLGGGGLDAVIESDVHILDVAALCLIVEEAGGRFTTLHGAPISAATTSVLAAATPQLHAELARRFVATAVH